MNAVRIPYVPYMPVQVHGTTTEVTCTIRSMTTECDGARAYRYPGPPIHSQTPLYATGFLPSDRWPGRARARRRFARFVPERRRRSFARGAPARGSALRKRSRMVLGPRVVLLSVCVFTDSLCGLSYAFPAADGIAAFPDYGPPCVIRSCNTTSLASNNECPATTHCSSSRGWLL